MKMWHLFGNARDAEKISGRKNFTLRRGKGNIAADNVDMRQTVNEQKFLVSCAENKWNELPSKYVRRKVENTSVVNPAKHAGGINYLLAQNMRIGDMAAKPIGQYWRALEGKRFVHFVRREMNG